MKTQKYITKNHSTGAQTAHWREDIGGGWKLEYTSYAGKTHGMIFREYYAGLRLISGNTLAEIRENAKGFIAKKD